MRTNATAATLATLTHIPKLVPKFDPLVTSESFAYSYTTNFHRTVTSLARIGYWKMDAEELAQAAWVRAWEKRRLYGGRCEFGTWVYVIAVNLGRRWMRKAANQPRRHTNIGELNDWISTDDRIQARIDAKIDLDKILNELTPIEIERLTERWIEGKEMEINRVGYWRALQSAKVVADSLSRRRVWKNC